MRIAFASLALVLVAWCAPALAQKPVNPENLQIGLSTDVVYIRADFTGADLTIFGALENVDPLVARQGRYDVIVVLEGPARPVVVRRKDRILGMWINTQSETFVNVPVSYSIATTRMLQDIAEPKTFRQLSLGADSIYLQPEEQDDPVTLDEFTDALRERKKATGLWNLRAGGVQFLSQNLFRASVRLARDVPVGTHKARAFLFKNGVFIKETSAPLAIVKSGFEQSISNFSREYSFLYGVAAVLIAILIGWGGSLVFRRE
ncbi:TIGR02186 family protein [Mesorhizobium sp. BAC0120]|uniref:TIGR02186 family protein n=1 Tax=Mesorhizobium sp. BAC0120 TaxID=3090670 RepID=UPI00298D2240|nr:TIGR02186 family protein [Mesorhizobium sp. BAC0120]MDW6025296.1 TIGR02186 family protein [Mesorhizobium sp. BAC0120]